MSRFLEQAIALWLQGGVLMAPLFLLTVYLYYTAVELLLRLRQHPLLNMKDMPDRSEADAASSAAIPRFHTLHTTEGIARSASEFRQEALSTVNRRIRFLSALTVTGPLLGLLGTVMGMLAVFEGLGGEQQRTLDVVAGGLSEALVTTQTGLMISLPAMVLLSLIVRQRNALALAILRLERQAMRRVIGESA